MRRPIDVKSKIHLLVVGRMFGADQREAHQRRRYRACHFLVWVNSVRITAGPCPGREQRAVGSLDGWPRSIQSRWRKWQADISVFSATFPGRCCLSSIRNSFIDCKTTADLSPSFHPHSSLSIIARCQLGVSRFSGCCHLYLALLDSARRIRSRT